MARGCLTCQKPIQSGFASVQRPKQRTSRRLQPIRRKEEGEEQKYNPADRGRREKEGDTQHRQDHGSSAGRRKYQAEPPGAARRESARAKGATNIFSSIFIKPLIFSPSFSMPARGHKCCERLVNPVPELRVNMARSGKKRTGRQAPHNGSLPPSSYFATSSESSRSTFDTSPHSFS